MAKIEILSRDGRTHELGLTTVIGRDPGSDVPVTDMLASRSHAEIRQSADGRFRIVDLGSTHGTYVDGRRVSEHLLDDGDEIVVGMTRLRFHAEAGAEPGAADEGVFVQERLAVEDALPTFRPARDVGDDQALRRDYERLRASYAVSRTMTLSEGLEGVLEKIADTAIEILQADRVAILLMDPETGVPTPRITRQKDGRSAPFSVSSSILREVTTRKVGILSADAGRDARFGRSESILTAGIRSAMCVPLLHGGELLGAIHCDTLLATNAFRNEDLALFSTIASQAAVAVRNVMLIQRVQDEARARVQFQRFLSPAVADEIISGRLRVSQRGEVLPITVFFLDVRGFTRMSEGMAPEAVVEMLNEFFDRIVPVLFEHEGTLDKYVGDELMALFGAPAPLAEAPGSAVRCALGMRDALEALNAEREARGSPRLSMGIGIHSGPALCGVIGSSKTRQYTAMGDTVNTASRLCQIAAPGQILVSEQTRAALGGAFDLQALPDVEVKGKSRPLTVFHVRGLAGA